MISNCVAHYKLNDNLASKVVLDAMSYSNGTSIRNTNLMHVDGKINGALDFNGTSDYVDTGATFQSVFQNSFSINLWCKTDELTQEQTLMGCEKSAFPYDGIIQFGLEFTDNGGTIWFLYQVADDESCFAMIENFLPVGVQPWTMITVVVNKLSASTINILLYANGTLGNIPETLNATMGHLVAGDTLYLGAFNLGDIIQTPFAGLLDAVSIFNKALSSEEISILYNSGRGTETFQMDNNLNATGESLFSMCGI